MAKLNRRRKLVGPIVAVLVGGALSQACDPGGSDGDEGQDHSDACGAELNASIDALSSSVAALERVSAEMQAELSVACSGLADGDEDDSLRDDDLQAKCSEAAAAVRASVTAGLTIEYVPGHCEINASAQLDCEANCSVDGSCQPGSIEARCEGGELSVECEGSCEGTVICEGSASVEAACEGECSGTCTGTCEGTCNGTCDGECSAMVMNANGEAECQGTCSGECRGECSATCTGTCDASCEFAADAEVTCDAQARCEGECMGTATAPRCEGELEPPSCDIDADCQAGCEGQAQFEAECTPPAVTVAGGVDVAILADIKTYLPTIFRVTAKAELAARAAGDVASSVVNVAGEITGSAVCAASAAADFVANIEAAAQASASVSISVQASAEVSASASG